MPSTPPTFDDVSHLCRNWSFGGTPPSRAYRSQCMQWTVQVFRHGDWLRVGIRKNKKGRPDESVEIQESWSFLWGIKEQLFPGRLAIEFYPKPSNVVNDAPMRWLFIVPHGVSFPADMSGKGLDG